jgi:chromate reductase, NAD(P)H dehydrogenase (quinone)
MRQDGQLEILTLCGSVRERSYNAALIRALPMLAPGGMVFVEAPLIVNIPHYDADLQQISGPPSVAAALVTAIREADAVLIASPEYNYSVPGTLKNAIDWASRVPNQPFSAKPVLIQSVSAGLLGGARMQYHLRQVLVSLDALVFTRPEVMVGMAPSKFDEQGNLIDEPTQTLVRAQLAAFSTFVRMYSPKSQVV